MEKIVGLTPFFSVSKQLTEAELGIVAAQGFRSLINNRPDNEADDQPTDDVLRAAAERLGLAYRFVPVISGQITDDNVAQFDKAMNDLKGPILAMCRTGTRSTTLWALHKSRLHDPAVVTKIAADAGFDLTAVRDRLEARWQEDLGNGEAAGKPATQQVSRIASFDVVVVGGGAAGIGTSMSLLRRRPGLSIAIIEPSDRHYYQPGWTLVGGGAYSRAKTERSMAGCMPKAVKWIKAAAAAFEPDHSQVVLEDGERIGYRALIVCPGIKLNWDGVEGLKATLGRNGVASNYAFDLSSYTWDMVQNMKGGTALFSQPPMPIKCAGAPQKAMYMSCSHWEKQGVLKNINVELNNAGGVLFGVPTFVPPLMKYVERYGAKLCFGSTLKAVDGPAKKAWFDVTSSDGVVTRVEKSFDFLHAVPPQCAPDFVRNSPLADKTGWVDVNPETLQHVRYGNIFSLGDVSNTPNAKTAAAVRKQAPVVAVNVLSVLDGQGPRALYDGYGGCPLIVERGRVVMAEFGYGGKLMPTFPLDPAKPRWSYWMLKASGFPFMYWELLLKGREWLASPQVLPHQPTPHEVQVACNFQEPKPRDKA